MSLYVTYATLAVEKAIWFILGNSLMKLNARCVLVTFKIEVFLERRVNWLG
jgi:hypothetical protein